LKKTTVGIAKTTIVKEMATTLAGTPAKAETPAEVEKSPAVETLATARLTTAKKTTGTSYPPTEHSDIQLTSNTSKCSLFKNDNYSEFNVCKA
jgi:hypothetical protein